MGEIDAVQNADRARRHEVAGHHADVRVRHRRVRQALADRGFDIQTHFAGRFFCGLQSACVGNAHAVRKLGFDAVQAHLLFDLRS